MKNRLLMYSLLVVVWLCVPWHISAKVYVNETFNELTSGLPNDWINKDPSGCGYNSNYPNLWKYHSSGYENTGCVYFDGWMLQQGCSNTLLTPMFTPETGGTIISFRYKNISNSKDLKVYVTDVDGVDSLQVLGRLRSSDWTQAEFYLNDFSGQSIRIAFLYESDYNTNPGCLLDDVVIEDPLPCASPVGLNVTNVGQTSVTLNWDYSAAGDKSSDLIIKVVNVATNEVLYDNTAISAPLKSYNITGLSAASKYKVELITDCSTASKGLSKTSVFEFSTLAGPVSLPYAQGFSVTDFSEIIGWERYADSEWNVALYDWDGHDAPGFMQISADRGTTTTVVLPQMAHEFTDVQLSMWLQGQKDANYTIGIVFDPKDISTFMELATYKVTKANQWYEFRMNTSLFTDFAGLSDVCLAIRLDNSDGYVNISIDDVRLDPIPSCPRLENVEIVSVDTASVTLSYYTYSLDAQVEARIKKNGESESVISAVIPVVDRSSNKATVEVKGLESTTGYTVEIRSACAADDKAEWSAQLDFTTPCGARRDLMFHETFSSENRGLPSCWVSEDSNPEGWSQWRIRTQGADNMYVYMSGSSDTSRVRLITQAVVIPAAGNYDVSFLMNRIDPAENGNDYGRGGVDPVEGLQVYISNSASVAGAKKCEFIPVNYKLAPAEKAAGWTEYVFNIDTEGVTYIIFEGISMGSTIQIDDVKIQEAPACRAVKYIRMDEPMATEAVISWRPEGGTTQWRVDYTLSSLLGDDTKTVVVNSNPQINITGLNSGTRYVIKGNVTAICGQGVEADPVAFEFVFETACFDYSAPFSENFDLDPFLPNCWSQYYSYKGYQGRVDMLDSAWVHNTDKSYIVSGNGSARMRKVNDRAYKSALVTPAIEIPETGAYRLTFYLSRDNRTEYDELLVMASTECNINEDTVLIASYRIGRSFEPVENSDGMYKYFVDIPDNVRGKRYFIFEGTCYKQDKDIYIDEVNISAISDCDYVSGQLRFDSIRHDAVRVYVQDRSVFYYQVEYGPKNFTLGTGTQAVLSANEPALYGLLPDSEYDIYVRRYCDATNQSEWSSRVQSFHTLCSPVDITLEHEFYDDFEDLNIDQAINSCYIQQFLDDTVLYSGRGADIASGVYPQNGRRYAGSVSGVNTYVLRPMTLRKGNYYEISAIFVSDDVNTSLTNVALVYGRSPERDASMTTVVTAQIGNKWTLVRGYIYNVPADGTYYVGWNMMQDQKAGFSGIDEFRVRQVTCVPPSKILADNVTSSSALLGWESVAGSWEVKVLTVNDADNTDAVVLQKTTDTKSLELNELGSNTRYYCFIRSICGDDDISAWSESVLFTTSCDMVDIPVSEDFEDALLADFSCWSRSASGEADRDLSISHSGGASLRASQVTVISPELNVESLADYRFSAYVYSINPDIEVTVGVMTDPNDNSTFEPITTLNVVREKRWTELLCYFKELLTDDFSFVKDARYIAVSIDADNVYIDDIMIDQAPACPQPTAPVINAVGGNSVEIGWTENGVAESWLVEVLQGGVHLFDTLVTTNPATVFGLDPVTEYSLNIQARCSHDDFSPKAEVGIFKTDCGAMKVPYKAAINLNDYSISFPSPFPTCWYQGDSYPETEYNPENSSASNMWFPNTGYGYITYTYNKEIGATSMLCSPAFNLTDALEPKLGMSFTLWDYDSLFVYVSRDGGKSYTVAIDTVTQTGNNINRLYDLEPYKGDNVSFGIQIKVGESAIDKWADARLNKFEITVTEPCSRPQGFTSYTATDGSVNVNFADNMPSHTQWEISYGKRGINPDAGTMITVDKQNFTVEGLLPKTDYDIYVRAACGEDSYSYWVGPYNVQTACAQSALLPYREAFETYSTIEESCLIIYNQDADDRQNHYPSASVVNKNESFYAGYVNEGEKSLFLKSSANRPLYVVLPRFDADLQNLQVRFDYRNQDEYEMYDSHIILGLMDPGTGDFIEYRNYPLSKKFSTQSYRFAYVAPEHAGYQIAFRFGDKKTNSYYAALDDIRVVQDLSCPPASRFDVVDVTTDSFAVVYSGISSGVDIAYGLAGTSPDNCTVISCDNKADNAQDTVVIKDLEQATTYYVFVRGRRDNGEVSEWSSPIVVTTVCDVIEVTEDAAYFENFDTYEETGNLFPPCFNILNTYVKQNVEYPVLTAANRISEPRSLQLLGNTVVALPELSVPLHQTILSFDVKGSSKFRVGLIDTLDYPVEIKYLQGGESYNDEYRGFDAYSDKFRHYEFDLTADTVQGKYIVFETVVNSSAYENYVFIDNVKVMIAPTCYEPRGLKMINHLDTAVSYEWLAAPDATSFEYRLDTFRIIENRISQYRVVYDTIYVNMSEGITDTTYLELDQLKPDTRYRLQLRTLCEANSERTMWINEFFTTLRPLGRIPYDNGFEDDEENASWYRTGEYAPGGWNPNTFIIDTAKAAVFKGEKSLYVRLYATPEYGYFAFEPNRPSGMPYTNYAYRYFYLEPGNYDVEYDWKQPSPANNSVARMFIVPASVELKSNDIHSYKNMVREGAIVVDEGEMRNQKEWKRTKVSFRLTEAGMYKLVLGWTGNDASKDEISRLPIAVDNITIENHQLNAPAGLQLDSAAGSEAWLSWTVADNDTFRVRVFDMQYNTVFDEMVYDINSVKITGLQLASQYRAQVRAQVGKYISEWISLDFTSECLIPQLPYSEDFNTLSVPEVPVCWNVDGNWETIFFNGSNVMNCDASSVSGKSEIVSPAFTVDKTGFHLTYSYYNNTSDGRFYLLVSTDGVNFNDTLISDARTFGFEDRWVDLDRYAGSNVIFKFVADIKSVSGNTRVSFDNFRIACVDKNVVTYEKETCSGSDFSDFGFDIPSDKIQHGGNYIFERLVKGATAEDCDHVERLSLSVGQSYRVTVNATTCKGVGYISEAFPVSEIYPDGLVETGQYIARLTSSDMCDSLVVLNLTVKDLSHTIDTVICEGDVYMFKGEQITASGVYVESLRTADGCDSVVTHNITVQPKEYVTTKYYCSGASYEYNGKRYTESNRFVEPHISSYGCDSNIVMNFVILPDSTVLDTTVCQGQSVIFAGKEYKKSGRYTALYQNVVKCDSLAVLLLTVTEPDTAVLSDVACEGRSYSYNGFYDVKVTGDTILYRIAPTDKGCDSIIELHIKYVETMHVDTTVIIQDGEVYRFGGNDLVKSGDYTETFESAFGCDSIVNLHLTVENGVDNIYDRPLTIAPNPVNKGDIAVVGHQWSIDEQRGLKVEIINSVGQIISSFVPDIYPISISPVNISGVYYIRITTGTGDVYIGKLIVK